MEHAEPLAAGASRSAPARRPLIVAVVIVLALNPIAALVAMLADLPAQFGEQTDPGSYLEWLVLGSAISAPILPIVLLAAGALLARRNDAWGVVGVALIAFAAVLFVVGGLGETFWRNDDGGVSDAVLTASTVAWVSIGLTLLVLAARSLLKRR